MESYGVLFSSRTGNTRALAEAICAALPQEACVYFGESGAAVPDIYSFSTRRRVYKWAGLHVSVWI